jgi:hypothetical protein
MSKKKAVFQWQVYFGIVLILTGALFLADLFLPVSLMRDYWPGVVVLFGLTFIIGMLAAGKRRAGLAIPGTIISVIGLILLVQNLFDLWVTWTYAWGLIIVAVGLGMLIMNAYLKRDTIRRVAGLLIGIGLTLFVIFGVLFELVFQVRGADLYSGIFLGGGLVLLGLFAIFGRLIFGRRQPKPDKAKPAKDGGSDAVEGEYVEVNAVPDPSGLATHTLPEGATFSGLFFKSVGEVYLIQGDPCGLKVEGNPDLVDNIQVAVHDDVLEIDFETDIEDWTNFRWADGDRPLRYYVTMPTIKMINMEGAGILTATSLKGEAMDLVQGGAGKVELHDLDYQSLQAELGGLGEIQLSGKVTRQNVDLTGAGGYQAEDLQSEDVEVMLSGAGEAVVWAEKTLKATVTGAGSIKYKGSPEVEQENSGIGEIKPL